MNAKQLVWIRSGGRCAICNEYLLDSDLGEVVPVGENAHIVGQKNTKASPRGDDELSLEKRDEAENLVLLCRKRHKIIDNKNLASLYTVAVLSRVKAAHEERIRRVTSIRAESRSAVLRLRGKIKGASVGLDRGLVASALIAAGRYPHYPRSFHEDGVEISVDAIPEDSTTYYATACEIIDREVTSLSEGVRASEVKHLSVFAFARLPLLVYLGHSLDDTFAIDVYQRHRATEDWTWDDAASVVEVDVPKLAVPDDATEAVVIVNMSGTIKPDELPESVSELPIVEVKPSTSLPEPDIFRNATSLSNFAQAIRSLLASLEADAKHVKKLHLFAACPVSAAVELGRALGPAAPKILVYDQGGDERPLALEISQ